MGNPSEGLIIVQGIFRFDCIKELLEAINVCSPELRIAFYLRFQTTHRKHLKLAGFEVSDDNVCKF